MTTCWLLQRYQRISRFKRRPSTSTGSKPFAGGRWRGSSWRAAVSWTGRFEQHHYHKLIHTDIAPGDFRVSCLPCHFKHAHTRWYTGTPGVVRRFRSPQFCGALTAVPTPPSRRQHSFLGLHLFSGRGLRLSPETFRTRLNAPVGITAPRASSDRLL